MHATVLIQLATNKMRPRSSVLSHKFRASLFRPKICSVYICTYRLRTVIDQYVYWHDESPTSHITLNNNNLNSCAPRGMFYSAFLHLFLSVKRKIKQRLLTRTEPATIWCAGRKFENNSKISTRPVKWAECPPWVVAYVSIFDGALLFLATFFALQ